MKTVLLLLSVLALTGCVSMEKVSLPANQKAEYSFAAYSVNPPAKSEWRFGGSDQGIQSVRFVHARHYASVTFSIKPVLGNASQEQTEQDIIKGFQEKILKPYKLSPDISLTEQSIKRSTDVIAGHSYDVLTIDFSVKEVPYNVMIYYRINEGKTIVYNFFVWKNLKNFKDPAWDGELLQDFKDMVAAIKFKNPSEKEMLVLRVDYAIGDVNDLLEDRYIKDKALEIKEKYEIAINEIRKWIKEEPKNHRPYFFMGDLLAYNKSFERFGEGFDRSKVEEYMAKSLSFRKYYRPPYETLAQMYKSLNELDKALANYDAALQISPNNDNFYYEAAQILESKGKIEEAKIYYKKAIRNWSGAAATQEELKVKLKEWEKK